MIVRYIRPAFCGRRHRSIRATGASKKETTMNDTKIETKTLTILALVFVLSCLKLCHAETMVNGDKARPRPACKSGFKSLIDFWMRKNQHTHVVTQTYRRKEMDISTIYPGLFRTAEEEYKLRFTYIHASIYHPTPDSKDRDKVNEEEIVPLIETPLNTQPSSDIVERDMCCPTVHTIRPYPNLVNVNNQTRTVVHDRGRAQYIHEGRCQNTNISCGCHSGTCLGRCYEVKGTQYILVYNSTGGRNFEPFKLRSHCACLNLQPSN